MKRPVYQATPNLRVNRTMTISARYFRLKQVKQELPIRNETSIRLRHSLCTSDV